MTSAEEVVEICSSDDVALVRLMWVDNAGVERARVVDAEDVGAALENGVNIAQVQQAFTALDYPTHDSPFGAVGEVRIVPDPETFRVLPYAERAAAMMCDIHSLDRTPWSADPRSSLSAFIDEFGFTPSTGFESEWYLVRDGEEGFEPFDNSGCFAVDGIQSTHDIVLETVDALKAQGMDLAVYYPEYGPGQQELVIEHASGLDGPDDYAFYKQTVKAVAREHGVRATFMPKPFKDGPGSGCHINLSLWDGDRNVFYDPDDDSSFPLSETARHFVGGLLDHAPGLLALTAPAVLSYKRLQPHSWASAFTCWGLDNREAMVRIPSTQWSDPEKTIRLEFKAVDNTANPYVALLGLLAAGKDGIDRELDPGEPLQQDPADLSEDEREARGVHRFPETLGEAVEALEADAVLSEALGGELYESYVGVKRTMWNDFLDAVTDWEIENYDRLF